jgi:hypothetical protein
MSWLSRLARLGFVAGAFFVVLPRVILAQVVVPPGSEVPIPPKPKTDTASSSKARHNQG